MSRGRRRLNAEAALPSAPEKARCRGIESVDGDAIRSEASQARPAPLDGLDGPVDHLLEPVDGRRDVDLFGRCVARIGLDLVVRAEPNRTFAFSLEVKALVGFDDLRQIAKARPADPQLNHCPALGEDADPGDAAAGSDRVGPCARRIDDDPG